MTDFASEIDQELATPPQTESESEPIPFRKALEEFVDLQLRRRDVEGELETINAALHKLEPMLLDNFADTGIQHTKVKGLTVYVRCDKYVSKKKEFSTEDICKTLQACGFGYLVGDSYSASSLKGLVSELKEKGESVPEALADKLNIGETVKLATRVSN